LSRNLAGCKRLGPFADGERGVPSLSFVALSTWVKSLALIVQAACAPAAMAATTA